MEEDRIKKKIEKEIVLDLMDWKAIEREAESGIRQALTMLKLHELTRGEAKWQIRQLKGKTSEEEAEIEKGRAEKLRTDTATQQ